MDRIILQQGYDKFTLIRNGEEKITCMDDLIAEQVSLELIKSIDENGRLRQYISTCEAMEIDTLSRIWDSFREGRIRRNECAELFGIVSSSAWDPCPWIRLTKIFQRACCDWKSSDTFLFDLLPARMVYRSVVDAGLESAYLRRKTSSHSMESLEHYLDLCLFLIDRKYVMNPSLVCRLLFLRDQLPGIVGLFRRKIATVSEEFRINVQYRLNHYIVERQPMGHSGIEYRPIDYYHLLVDLGDSQLVEISPETVKRNLVRAYTSEANSTLPTNLAKKEHVGKILELVRIPESSLTFSQRFQLAPAWTREPIQTMMTVRHFEGNVVHVLPMELMILIFENLF